MDLRGQAEGTTVGLVCHLPAQAGISQSTWHRILSRQLWSVLSEGDSTASLSQCTGDVFSHIQVEFSAHQFLPFATCPSAWQHWLQPLAPP